MGQFERVKYPDGQISAIYHPERQENVNQFLMQRINSYEDLFYVRAIADSTDVRDWTLFIPCLFGQRSDRRFNIDQSFDLKLICDIINDCKFAQVDILDPHSDVSLALINNSHKISPLEYVTNAVSDILSKTIGRNDVLLVSPDAGAYKKVFEFGEELELPVMGAMKHRSRDGKIDLMFTHDVEGKDCLIVDDLCDGGYTFELLAQALRDHKAKSVYLYVSHGLFSKGFVKLYGLLNHIYCTNSVKDIANGPIDENVDWHEWKAGHLGEPTPEIKDFLTQYKVI